MDQYIQQFIKLYLKKNKITQTSLAKELGISQPTISRIIRSKQIDATLIILNYIIKHSEDPPTPSQLVKLLS
jgi:transcriptional regulator with XRE-family HTH domain